MQSTGYYPFGQQPYMMQQQQQQQPLMAKPHQLNPGYPPPPIEQNPTVINKNEEPFDDEENDEDKKPMRNSGRRKIKIEYIEDKTRRHITFSKRKAGIMKKVCIHLSRVFFFVIIT
jgi:hypothetical protein